MNTKATFEMWNEKYGVRGVRFYPQNPTDSSPTSILESASKSVQAIRDGRVVAYKDPAATEVAELQHHKNA